MTEAEMIRAIFDRINQEPESGRAALRARIVRACRGEVPAGAPYQGGYMGEVLTLEQRAERGREAIARRREEEFRGRAEKLEALRKCVASDLEPEILAHVAQLAEQPGNGQDYFLRIEIDGYAPLVCNYLFTAGGWTRVRWVGGMCRLWAVVPWPNATPNKWKFAEDLNEALAVAQDCAPSHCVLAEEEPEKKLGWWETFLAYRARCGKVR